jgi:hypothetical protein
MMDVEGLALADVSLAHSAVVPLVAKIRNHA